MTCMGMIGGRERVNEQEKIRREEVMKVMGNLKNANAAGEDGIKGEMLQYGGETVAKSMHKIVG